MSYDPEEKPDSQSNLDSPEYRKRLMRKLNTLIAVLEVACAKIRRTLENPEADRERLNRIKSNLSETLSVCRRAKRALERREALPEGLPASITGATVEASKLGRQEQSVAERVELDSDAEREKFSKLGPIDANEVRACDLDDLCRQLLDD
jgi:DNA repair ATPase RecN